MARNEVQKDLKYDQPIVESSIRTSEDGKWVIFKTTFTTIKSVKYLEKVLEPDEKSSGISTQKYKYKLANS
jgi:hypothetical protein